MDSHNKQAVSTSHAAQLINFSELHKQEPDANAAELVGNINPLLQVKAKLQVSVGDAVVSVGELMNAKEHHVITLDRKLTQPVDLILDGKVIARGQLVAVDDHFAVRITELPISLKTL